MSKTKPYNVQEVLALVHQVNEPLTLASLITTEIGADRWNEAMKVFRAAKAGTVH